MEEQIVTCTSVGVYKYALTRGKAYKVVDQDADKYRIIGDHGRRIWISKGYFETGEVPVMQMIDWKFDDDIMEWNIVEVTISFNNGSRRWCNMTTPDKLVEHFNHSMMDPPGMYIDNLIIMKSLDIDDVEQTLRYLDSQGELVGASRFLG
ncbi:hypothetical protein [Paenibacillus kobensis]|uniref:hypothetical protein n=1 Tax=Paenibacillus kobensis TaxID=59841 RepID=UPI000FDAB583|nr:hypothetical protein [Paenibacillus kobensis]